MTRPESAKELLVGYNKKRYKSFILDDEQEELTLPSVSRVPGVVRSTRQDAYRKHVYPPTSDSKVQFISKNDKPYGVVWKTKPSKIKEAVRWGVIKPQSITGKVIATLGTSRAIAHAPIAKGMIGNSFTLKMKLLDLFQDRFEALEDIESLVNKENTIDDYNRVFDEYVRKIEEIKDNLYHIFPSDESGFSTITLQQLQDDLETDKLRALEYKNLLNHNDLRTANRARGTESALEFVKQQMIFGLYELQGINQDNTFSLTRDFAFSRGNLNDIIEDSLKLINDHQPDLRNAVTQQHHGNFADNDDEFIYYDFSEDSLSPQQERDALLAISFIEGWDQVYEDPETHIFHVKNDSGDEVLETISATKWQTHRNFGMFLKSIGYYIYNTVAGIFVPTTPWQEQEWENPKFHLVATDLQLLATPNEPLWKKIAKAFQFVGQMIKDTFHGVRDFGTGVALNLPSDLRNDWASVKNPASLSTTLTALNLQIQEINSIEGERLNSVLTEEQKEWLVQEHKPSTGKFATIDYSLSSTEYNDLLNSLTKNLYDITSVFTHNVYSKDPIGGLIFSAAFIAGAGAIWAPTATSAILGQSYVHWFSTYSSFFGDTKLLAALGAGSTQAQVAGIATDVLFNGPKSSIVTTAAQVIDNPLLVGAAVAATYGVGYLLVNGIAGQTIPFLSEYLRESLGSVPETGYPVVGAKALLIMAEGFAMPQDTVTNDSEHSPAFKQLAISDLDVLDDEMKRIVFASWLSQNRTQLTKLDRQQSFALSQQMDALFTPEQSKSLKKLLYPEKSSSIIFQLITIPLSYIPALLRIVFSFALTIAALASNQDRPFQPIKRAFTDLWDKIKIDLTRIVTAVSTLLYLAYSVVATLIKTVALAATLIVGRLAAIFDLKPAHGIYQGFAHIHVLSRNIGEIFFPTRVMKDVTVAHPSHTIKEVESSYARMLQARETEAEYQKEEADLAPIHHSFEITSGLSRTHHQEEPTPAVGDDAANNQATRETHR